MDRAKGWRLRKIVPLDPSPVWLRLTSIRNNEQWATPKNSKSGCKYYITYYFSTLTETLPLTVWLCTTSDQTVFSIAHNKSTAKELHHPLTPSQVSIFSAPFVVPFRSRTAFAKQNKTRYASLDSIVSTFRAVVRMESKIVQYLNCYGDQVKTQDRGYDRVDVERSRRPTHKKEGKRHCQVLNENQNVKQQVSKRIEIRITSRITSARNWRLNQGETYLANGVF